MNLSRSHSYSIRQSSFLYVSIHFASSIGFDSIPLYVPFRNCFGPLMFLSILTIQLWFVPHLHLVVPFQKSMRKTRFQMKKKEADQVGFGISRTRPDPKPDLICFFFYLKQYFSLTDSSVNSTFSRYSVFFFSRTPSTQFIFACEFSKHMQIYLFARTNPSLFLFLFTGQALNFC